MISFLKQMKGNWFPEKAFWKRVLLFSVPIALQNTSSAVLGIIDVSTISSLGEVAVAAVSLATQLFYIVSLITFGIASGASVYLSRYYGEKNPSKVRGCLCITVAVSLVVNGIAALLCLLFPRGAIGIFTTEAATVEEGAKYLLIITPTFLLYSLSYSMVAFFRSVKLPKVPMVAIILSLLLKVALNYPLIYGFGPIPAMGVAGAALSTLISRIAELLIFLVYYFFLFREREYVLRSSDLKQVTPSACLSFLGQNYPVIINESLWGVGVTLFNAVFGRMSVSAVTAMSVARQLENLGNAFFQGIGVGACVSLSYMLGEGQKKGEDPRGEVHKEAIKYALAAFYVGVGIMVVLLLVDLPYVRLFFSDLPAATQSVAIALIAVTAFYFPFRSLASALIIGVFRAVGDTKRAMYYDVLPIYLWSLPLGFLLGLEWNCSVVIVLLVMQFKRVIKCIFGLRRLLSGAWLPSDRSQ